MDVFFFFSLESNHPAFSVGDIVLAPTGWPEYAAQTATAAKVDRRSRPSPTPVPGLLGMPGLTAYTGLLNIGQPKPGETLAVAAARARSAVVRQVGKLKGCRVIVAGGADKVRYVTEELGFDVGLDHRAPDFAEQLRAAVRTASTSTSRVGGQVCDACSRCSTSSRAFRSAD